MSKIELPLPNSDSTASLDSGFMENPSVNDSIAGSSKAGSVCSDMMIEDEVEELEESGVITKAMIIEEEKLRIQADKEMEKICLKLEAEEHDKEIEKKKYQRLLGLLEKSQFYSSFASTKLDQLKEKAIGKQSKTSKKKRPLELDVENTPPPKAAKMERTVSDSQRILTDHNTEERVKVGEKSFETRVTSLGITVPSCQPKLLIGASLRDYQMEGLNWLKMLFLGGMNGILADEMGLGKTIQIISLICHLYEERVGGPFLIVAPLSTLPNWIHEFEAFAPDIPVVLYHGDKKARSALHQQVRRKHNILGQPSQPVVITSFEVPLKDKNFLEKVSWKYIIVDEGHRLKNHNTLLARTLREFRSVNRMLLTGTPLQNNLYELWSLLNFLMPEVFDKLEDFHAWFVPEEMQELQSHDSILEKEKENHIISTLHKILEPFLLRRVKTDVNLNLPPKKEKYIFCPLTDVQYKLYSQTVDRSIFTLKEKNKPEELIIPDNPDGTRAKRRNKFSYKNLASMMDSNSRDSYDMSSHGNSKKSTARQQAPDVDKQDVSEMAIDEMNGDCFKGRFTILNIMMMLRKICNHPYLVQKLVYPGSDILRVDERIITSSGKMMVLDSLLHRLKQRNHKVLIFSTFNIILDLIEAYMDMKEYTYVRLDGSTKIEDRRVAIKQFNTDSNIFAFLISTRAGGLGINLTSADTVIIFDSDWNPQVDLQAQDRCHRIGQTKPVTVFRLITPGTVDERIVSRAQAKRKLEKVVIQAGAFKYNRLAQKDKFQLDLESLKTLLDEKTHNTEIHSNGSVLTDEQWENLLER